MHVLPLSICFFVIKYFFPGEKCELIARPSTTAIQLPHREHADKRYSDPETEGLYYITGGRKPVSIS